MSPTIYCAPLKMIDAVPGVGMATWMSRLTKAEQETPLTRYVNSLGTDMPAAVGFMMYHLIAIGAIAVSAMEYLSR